MPGPSIAWAVGNSLTAGFVGDRAAEVIGWAGLAAVGALLWRQIELSGARDHHSVAAIAVGAGLGHWVGSEVPLQLASAMSGWAWLDAIVRPVASVAVGSGLWWAGGRLAGGVGEGVRLAALTAIAGGAMGALAAARGSGSENLASRGVDHWLEQASQIARQRGQASVPGLEAEASRWGFGGVIRPTTLGLSS